MNYVHNHESWSERTGSDQRKSVKKPITAEWLILTRASTFKSSVMIFVGYSDCTVRPGGFIYMVTDLLACTTK